MNRRNMMQKSKIIVRKLFNSIRTDPSSTHFWDKNDQKKQHLHGSEPCKYELFRIPIRSSYLAFLFSFASWICIYIHVLVCVVLQQSLFRKK